MIFNTDNYPISIYSICFAIAVLAGFSVATAILLIKKRNKTAIICAAMLNIILLFYGGLMFSFLVNIDSGKLSFGLTSMGGAFGLIIGSFIMYCIYKDTELLKAYMAVLPLIYSISKLGCFFAGCCGGIEYHGPMAINYIRHSENMYPDYTFPIQLLESIVFMLIFIIVIALYKKYDFRIHIAVNGAICCVAKFGLDFLRSSHIKKIISMNQILCLVVLILTIVMIVFGNRIFSKARTKKSD